MKKQEFELHIELVGTAAKLADRLENMALQLRQGYRNGQGWYADDPRTVAEKHVKYIENMGMGDWQT